MGHNHDFSQFDDLGKLLEDSPNNWGRWGDDDEVGALNFLDHEQIMRGLKSARQGKVFTLQVQMGHPHGDPVFPGRTGMQREMVFDDNSFEPGGNGPQYKGGIRYSDDKASIFLQGSTQYDALGHAWYDGKLWNGKSAETTNEGGMDFASVLPIAERGVVGRGVLIDMARHRGKEWLEKGETFTHEDLLEAAAAQGVEIQKRDILVVRTGWMKYWYSVDADEFNKDLVEPGLTYTPELVDWFMEREIPNLVTDTIANEVTYEPTSGIALVLHGVFLRNLGISLTEIAWLDDLADSCAEDGQWDFLYTAAPLKVVRGTGSPVNPIVIK